MPTSSKSMRTPKHERRIQSTLLHSLSGMLALALVGCSLLCIYWYLIPAHASSGALQANGQAMSGQVAFAETETETASPTVTSTPSPTMTTPSTPTPSPSATRIVTPSPASTRSGHTESDRPAFPAATGPQTPSPVATAGSSPTSIIITTQATGAIQTPVSLPSPANNLSGQESQRTHLPGNPFPFSALLIGLGSVALLGLLLVLGWMILRRRLLPPLSPKFPPSGAASWSRTRKSEQEDLPPRQGYATYNAPSARLAKATPGKHALPTMAAISVLNLPVFSLRDDGTPAATSPAWQTRPPAGISHTVVADDGSYLAARISQRRNELRATEDLQALHRQTPGDLSAEITELNDPYLQSLLQLYRARKRM